MNGEHIVIIIPWRLIHSLEEILVSWNVMRPSASKQPQYKYLPCSCLSQLLEYLKLLKVVFKWPIKNVFTNFNEAKGTFLRGSLHFSNSRGKLTKNEHYLDELVIMLLILNLFCFTKAIVWLLYTSTSP